MVKGRRGRNDADAIKCFDKLWLKDWLLEMYNFGYDPNTLKCLS